MIRTTTELKHLFRDGAKPTGRDFSDFIDSFWHKADNFEINPAQGIVSITNLFPLPQGEYYNHDTAINTIPSGQRMDGIIITYKTSDGEWQVEQFKGGDWDEESSWTGIGSGGPSGSYHFEDGWTGPKGTYLDADGNLSVKSIDVENLNLSDDKNKLNYLGDVLSLSHTVIISKVEVLSPTSFKVTLRNTFNELPIKKHDIFFFFFFLIGNDRD